MKKILITVLITLAFSLSVNAGTNGENNMSKKNSGQVKDCFESINRATFKFNQILDNAIFEPLAKAYRVLPSPVRTGASNMLNNLSNLMTIPNNILQGDFKKAGENVGRLAVNTTLGILGVFDIAQTMGFTEYEKEDYGQSLGMWGVSEGCYVVLPVIGPSTVRDSVGSITSTLGGGDMWYNISARKDTHHFSDFDYWGSKSASGVDFRAKNIDSFNNLEQNSMDFYASVRSLYLQDRQQKVLNSQKITETLNDADWEEIEAK